MSTTYVCAMCRKEFVADRSDADALAETAATFGEAALSEPLDVVCDDCWRMVCPDDKPISLS